MSRLQGQSESRGPALFAGYKDCFRGAENGIFTKNEKFLQKKYSFTQYLYKTFHDTILIISDYETS